MYVDNRTSTVVIARPGHELRVFGWLEKLRPVVHVLTDGSGRSGRSRIQSTAKIVHQTGSRQGSLFGHLTDQKIYDAVLAGDVELFVNFSQQLAFSLFENSSQLVIGDAAENEMPVHDVCRAVIDTAVRLASAMNGTQIQNLEFAVVGRQASTGAFVYRQLSLDQATFDRKIAAALAYPEINAEVKALFKKHGTESFRVECLREVSRHSLLAGNRFRQPPSYEAHGVRMVEEGTYDEVLRFQDHVIPILMELENYAKSVEENVMAI